MVTFYLLNIKIRVQCSSILCSSFNVENYLNLYYPFRTHFWLLISFETRYFLKLCPALCFTTKHNLLYLKYPFQRFWIAWVCPYFFIVHWRIRSRHLECMLIVCIVVQHCKTTNYTFLMSDRLWSFWETGLFIQILH